MFCFPILLFVIKLIPPKYQDMCFSIFLGLQNANKNEFHGFGKLAIWLWKSFGDFLQTV